ncbi:unnamed protein product [Blepharisma stoltei]|uniref:NAD-dependent epimerase/dehydratase domain-containing protein n=1 Tax=Blepharisma stoltei TaxID=1481888 RepID=A0AAU9JT72_9CILI|nr:unnamed protein product [Blepharisma stoltei]
MRVFLTGATGSVGSSVLENLLSHGHDVTCTVRNEEKGQVIASKGDRAHYIILDINDKTAHQLAELAVGYDAIIECAQLPFTNEGVIAQEISVDALIQAAKKTAETKHVSLVYTSGIGVIGNTTGVIDEDHDDTSHSWEFSTPRILREKKVINASTENLHGVSLRVSWVYGNSTVDHWIRACKSQNKIVVANQNDTYIPFIHHEDLASMFRILIEQRAYGMFFAVEPESASLQSLIERVAAVGNIHEIERVDNAWAHISGPYGFFLLGHTLNEQVYPRRLIELYGFRHAHKILDWVSSFTF